MLSGPFESAQSDGRQHGAPLNSNTWLLWYRESKLGDRPVPCTWDELLDIADALGTNVQQTGRRAESLMVFFNALVESAGTTVVNEERSEIVLEEQPTVTALEVMKRYAQSAVAPQALSTSGEDDNRLAFQSADSDSTFMINWPYVYPSVRRTRRTARRRSRRSTAAPSPSSSAPSRPSAASGRCCAHSQRTRRSPWSSPSGRS